MGEARKRRLVIEMKVGETTKIESKRDVMMLLA
jgi:hypothetical protein